jgi:hypothetical protein
MTRQATRPRVLARGVLGLLGTVSSPAGGPVLFAATPADGEIVTSPDDVRLTFDRPFAVAVALLAAAASVPGQAQLALTGSPADGNQHARIELLEAR